MSIISMILVVIVAFLAGMESVLDQFEFHQPLVACTLIGLVTGNLEAGVILGGTLQMIALGWANIGAAVAPDAAFASVALIFILVSYFLDNSGFTEKPLTEEEKYKMEQFERQVEAMKTDTLMPVVTRKKKHSKPVVDINPFDDEMERQD